ncbi:FAD-dependent oxidoreductase, partial [Streptomyces sp. NPDC004290]
AGGYVGSGVATTNLAARTLCDLVQQDSGQAGPTELTALPWVNHRVRKWEPEPLRWLGVHGMYATYRTADRRELLTHSVESARLARLADRVAGRH